MSKDPTNLPNSRRFGRPSPRPSTRQIPPPSGEWVTLGEIVAPFGLHGEVKLLAQTDFPERIAQHSTLYLGPEHRPFPLKQAHPHSGVILLKFEGIDDMTAAEKLRGLSVTIPEETIAPLATDQYYIHDLIGLQATHVNGAQLGVIADVYSGAAQDLIVVRRPGVADVLVPLVKAIVVAVDLTARTVTIDPPAGLFDDDWVEDEQ